MTKTKITWKDLESLGQDENLFFEFKETLRNIDEIHQETREIFERIFIDKNIKQGFKNFVQLCAILENEMEKALKIIDIVLDNANKAKKKN